MIPAVVDACRKIPTMAPAAIAAVRNIEAQAAQLPQVALDVDHVLHGGMYARTITIPAGAMITGALIKIPTMLFLAGDASVFTGEEKPKRFVGEHLLLAGAGRKQAFYAHTDTQLTMVFPTQAKTVAEAESEFTDEVDLLSSRDSVTKNNVIITGE